MHILKVQGMSCGHCVRAVTQALQNLDPAAQVEVDLAAGEVRVASDMTSEQLGEAIREQGYAVA